MKCHGYNIDCSTHIIRENGTGALELALPGEALGHEAHTLTLICR